MENPFLLQKNEKGTNIVADISSFFCEKYLKYKM